MAQSLNSKFLATAGTISWNTQDYNTIKSTITTLTGSNYNTVQAQLEALTYAEVGEYQNFREELSLDDEQEIMSAKCGSGTIEVSRFKNALIGFDWRELDDVDLVAKMLGLTVQTTTAWSVNVVDRVINFATLDTAVEIPQDADGTRMTITGVKSAVLGAGTASVEGTDYEVTKVWDKWYMLPITGGNMSALTNYYLTGSYAGLGSKKLGFNFQRESMPFGVYKFVSCPQELNSTEAALYSATHVRRTSFYVKMAPNANIVRLMQDRDIAELAAQSVELLWKKGWLYLNVKEYITI